MQSMQFLKSSHGVEDESEAVASLFDVITLILEGDCS